MQQPYSPKIISFVNLLEYPEDNFLVFEFNCANIDDFTQAQSLSPTLRNLIKEHLSENAFQALKNQKWPRDANYVVNYSITRFYFSAAQLNDCLSNNTLFCDSATKESQAQITEKIKETMEKTTELARLQKKLAAYKKDNLAPKEALLATLKDIYGILAIETDTQQQTRIIIKTDTTRQQTMQANLSRLQNTLAENKINATLSTPSITANILKLAESALTLSNTEMQKFLTLLEFTDIEQKKFFNIPENSLLIKTSITPNHSPTNNLEKLIFPYNNEECLLNFMQYVQTKAGASESDMQSAKITTSVIGKGENGQIIQRSLIELTAYTNEIALDKIYNFFKSYGIIIKWRDRMFTHLFSTMEITVDNLQELALRMFFLGFAPGYYRAPIHEYINDTIASFCETHKSSLQLITRTNSNFAVQIVKIIVTSEGGVTIQKIDYNWEEGSTMSIATIRKNIEAQMDPNIPCSVEEILKKKLATATTTNEDFMPVLQLMDDKVQYEKISMSRAKITFSTLHRRRILTILLCPITKIGEQPWRVPNPVTVEVEIADLQKMAERIRGTKEMIATPNNAPASSVSTFFATTSAPQKPEPSLETLLKAFDNSLCPTTVENKPNLVYQIACESLSDEKKLAFVYKKIAFSQQDDGTWFIEDTLDNRQKLNQLVSENKSTQTMIYKT